MPMQLRLTSVVRNGVGVDGPECGFLEIIYYYLFQEFGESSYSAVFINQIGDDLSEGIVRDRRVIYINVLYSVGNDFDSLSQRERNSIRLDIINIGLTRIANYEGKIDLEKMTAIRDRILLNDFEFSFVCKSHVNKRDKNRVAKIIIQPQKERFYFYVQFENAANVICKICIYQGSTSLIYYKELFQFGSWKGPNDFSIKGKAGEVEFKCSVESCKVEIINLTRYEQPPYFEMMRRDNLPEDRKRAHDDWIDSLPPSTQSLISRSRN